MSNPETPTMDTNQLQSLIEQVASERNRQAFERLFEHFAPLLKSYSLARDPGAHLVADELVQEVLIKLWNKAHLYDPVKANPNTWIYTLARNCRIDYLRRNGRYGGDINADQLFDTLEDDGRSPFELTQQKRIAEQIHRALSQLPVEQSQVLAKTYMEGKTQQEIADELNLPLGTVKSRIRLALQKLEIIIGGQTQ
ncbi:sigma-70 family RNA polymerase sigma factor [Kineobactrum salinum]|uniref:Sigma-70 family RNA polymerase sigma factor n=1 Tax=Kineobactrum salinum TaxID=2708301 RepID=A0A6C0U0G0_9GAMM|nr:sigma-70 family RNA polymerase sigma factor [Kineobactrum salinum]QIB65398.1 sigma-70 family RNA polymerase sigma factor [Kineobactrum salinum]